MLDTRGLELQIVVKCHVDTENRTQRGREEQPALLTSKPSLQSSSFLLLFPCLGLSKLFFLRPVWLTLLFLAHFLVWSHALCGCEMPSVGEAACRVHGIIL